MAREKLEYPILMCNSGSGNAIYTVNIYITGACTMYMDLAVDIWSQCFLICTSLVPVLLIARFRAIFHVAGWWKWLSWQLWSYAGSWKNISCHLHNDIWLQSKIFLHILTCLFHYKSGAYDAHRHAYDGQGIKISISIHTIKIGKIIYHLCEFHAWVIIPSSGKCTQTFDDNICNFGP